jgi:hypothetical protein
VQRNGDGPGPAHDVREGWGMSVEMEGGEAGHDSLPSLTSSCCSSPLGTRLLRYTTFLTPCHQSHRLASSLAALVLTPARLTPVCVFPCAAVRRPPR